MNRRTCLQTLAAAAVSLPQLPKALQAQQLGEPVRVDTHLHCFAGTENSRFPYHERAPYRPQEPATPQHLLQCMKGAGVDYAVVVHPEPYQDDHRYLQYCLKTGAGKLKGTALVFADRPGSVEKLAGICERMPIVAARVHAYVEDRLPPFGKPELRHLWKTASDLGLALQLHFEPKYAPGFEPYIREFPSTQVLIDHLGRPFQGTKEEHDRVIRWARFPNTVMKLSSIPDNRNYPHRRIEPIIEKLISEYGPERLMYGGGYNAQAGGASYRAAFEHARTFLGPLSKSEQNAVLGGNAKRLFKFE